MSSETTEIKNKPVNMTHTYHQVHDDLEQQKYAGSYGWDNATYMAIAEVRENVDLKKIHSDKRLKDNEYYVPSLKKLIDHPTTQKRWDGIATFDPKGLTANTPTIAATTSKLNIPELKDLERDGTIVNKDGSVNTVKIAIYYAWNLPELSKRLNMTEDQMRNTLYKYSGDKKLLDPEIKVYLPPVGGMTIYTFGNLEKILDKSTNIAVRVHDSCNGSDVFGTDICTCRPYLMFALKNAIECAQEGGVGIIIYFRKEGRSLGEITKFRVYNARKNQVGGDRAEKYFFHTENIAGIRDARFQTMMPDGLLYLGISRIDYLYSMSNEKYDALVGAGITIQQRVPLPDRYVPKGAFVELHAKIASGYHTEDIQSEECVSEIRKLKTVRIQCYRVKARAEKDKLCYFTYHPENIKKAVEVTVECTDKFYPGLKDIQMHSRFRHFDEEQMTLLKQKWTSQNIDTTEQIRRLVDLATVSVLLDAGAGKDWQYVSKEGKVQGRSEGLAVASFEMFVDGLFSSDKAVKTRVNSLGLMNVTEQELTNGFQVTKLNTIVGLKGRTKLLQDLGKALEDHKEFFGYEVQRPGNVVDYLLKMAKNKKVSLEILWNTIIKGLERVWPENLSGVNRGDVWCYQPLKIKGQIGSDIIPFHKLSQWLCLSWLEPLKLLDIEITDLHLLTCLAEYRNGGLLIDTGILQLRKKEDGERAWDVGSQLIVEWRAMTVAVMDNVADEVRKHYKKTEQELTLANILEGGTWRAGRLTAERLRGHEKRPPIKIRSDGTVF